MQYKLYTPLAIHETGNRTNQEDALWPQQTTADDRLFIVCDGMGGHEKGEVASQTVSRALGQWFKEHVISGEPFTDEQLSEAIEYAYTKLDEYDNGSAVQMGTTLTLLYMHRHGVTAAHIGDSRIYHIRPNEGLLYQSRDHSQVFELFQAGEITYEEMGSYAQKNIITRAMTPGREKRMRPDIVHITDVKPDDWFYMCSDGMLEQMDSNELAALLSANGSDEKKRQQLIAATHDNQDNHTAWMIHVESVISERGDEQLLNEEPTAKCNVLHIIKKRQQADASAANEDDVVVVSVPRTNRRPVAPPIKRHLTLMEKLKKVIARWWRPVLILLILLLLLWLVWHFFLNGISIIQTLLK